MPSSHHIVVLAVVFEGGLLILAMVLGGLLARPPLAQLQFSWSAIGLGTVATLPLLLGLVWGLRSRWIPFQRLLRTVDEMLVPMFAGCATFDLAMISVLAGVGEEVLFRGLIQPVLADWTGPVIGLAVTSILFGLAHLVTPMYAVLAGFIGMYLGSVVMASENLAIAVIAHALYDFVALLYLRRRGQAPPAAIE